MGIAASFLMLAFSDPVILFYEVILIFSGAVIYKAYNNKASVS
jgi:hypothetical protein